MSEEGKTAVAPAEAVVELSAPTTQSSRSRIRGIAWIALAVAAGVFLYLGRPFSDELSFVKRFDHSETVQQSSDDGSDIRIMVIKGDQGAILAALPGGKSLRPDSTPQEFKLPSGRHGMYLYSPKKQQAVVTVEGNENPFAIRAFHRLGVM